MRTERTAAGAYAASGAHSSDGGADGGAIDTSRRRFLKATLLGTVGAWGATGLGLPAAARGEEKEKLPADLARVGDRSAQAPTQPVSIARVTSYEAKEVAAGMSRVFDALGGLESLLRGKTVTVKLNITGDGRRRMARQPAERTYQTHPVMVEVLCGLFRKAGASRIVLVESYYQAKDPREILARHGWDIPRIESAAEHRVEFADTRNRGAFPNYAEIRVPYGGYVFPTYKVNRHYVDTDVFVSLAKLKNHVTAGITCAVKNLFGMAPTSLYGNDAPNEDSIQNRGALLHHASRKPPAGVADELHALPEELGDSQPRIAAYRVPRVTADLFAARPTDLAIVDGIEAVSGGEGPWCPPPHRHTTPGLVLAGRNAVTLDAISVAVMGYEPRAGYTEHPFPGENHLNLLARGGVGVNDPARIEVRGMPLKDALHEYHPNQGGPGWIRRELVEQH